MPAEEQSREGTAGWGDDSSRRRKFVPATAVFTLMSRHGSGGDGVVTIDHVCAGAVGVDATTRGGGNLWRLRRYLKLVDVHFLLPSLEFAYPFSLVLYLADSLPRRKLPYPG